ncbi:hypothetical protein FA15DRAFT_675135 [Coprinopsis marcescibilis]|uniref:MYND-type domain-containing protein n=1 Tax=Coprinopsis marcescibilis TaxID=230819 RepID=A0A5C3KF08_COPMA|nr:hypothetical protein FA15DRAFT_675135 [Coprinopsis marcescibilis]
MSQAAQVAKGDIRSTPNRAIPRAVIERAKRGETGAVVALKDLLSPTNYNLEILDTFLLLVDKKHVPDIPSGQYKLRKHTESPHKATKAISALDTVIMACTEQPDLKGTTVDRIVAALEGIVMWMFFLLYFGISDPMETRSYMDFRMPYWLHAHAVLGLMNFDDRITTAMFDLPCGMDLIIKFWTTTGRKDQVFHNLLDPEGCVITRLITKCVSRPDGLEALGRRTFCAAEDLPSHFLECGLRRVAYIESIDRAHLEPKRAAFHILSVVRAIDLILDYAPLTPLFFRAREMRGIYGLIHTTRPLITGPPNNDLLECAIIFFNIAARKPRSFRKGLVDLFEDDYIPFVFELLLWHSKGLTESSAAIAQRLFANLEVYSSVPGTCYRIRNSMGKCFRDYKFSPISGCPELCVPLRALFELSQQRSQLWTINDRINGSRDHLVLRVEGAGIYPMCDNFECPRNRQRAFKDAKKCVSCSSVVYCSHDCQNEDWRSCHRKECPYMRLIYAEEISSQEWYGHTTRAAQMAIIEDAFMRTCTGELPMRSSEHEETSQEKFILSFDATRPSPRYQLHSSKRHPDKIVPPHIRQRVRQMFVIGRIVNGTPRSLGDSVQFVEGAFPWGRQVVTLLVRLSAYGTRLDAQGKPMLWQAVHSVAYIA